MHLKTALSWFVFYLFVLVSHSYGLQCKSGSTARSFVYSVDVWKEKNCENSSKKCVLVETQFSILNNFVSIRSTSGSCVESSACNNSCEKVFQKLVKEGSEESDVSLPIDITTLSLDVTSCKMECCSSNFCNQNSLENIRQVESNIAKIVSTNLPLTRFDTTTTTMSTSNRILSANIVGETSSMIHIPTQNSSAEYKRNESIEEIIIPKIRKIHNNSSNTEVENSTPNNAYQHQSTVNYQTLVTDARVLRDSPTQGVSSLHYKKQFDLLLLISLCFVLHF